MVPENDDVVGGRYRILGRLGKGAMGVVLMAYDPVLDRKVAIKQITAEIAENPGIRQRFSIEARAAARLNHPNIVTIHELHDSGDEIYMVMELMEGTSLAGLMAATRVPLPIESALDVIAQVCDGLAYAHQHEVIHRDIKPANLFLGPTGVVKILDFGIARVGSLHVTASGAMIGTPDYMSPEQVRGEEIDGRSDLWAAGVVLYQLLSGARPFQGRPLAVLLAAILEQPHVPLIERDPSIPARVSELVDRMLAKKPDGRPSSAALVRDELRAILGRDGPRPSRVEVKAASEETLIAGGVPPPLPAATSAPPLATPPLAAPPLAAPPLAATPLAAPRLTTPAPSVEPTPATEVAQRPAGATPPPGAPKTSAPPGAPSPPVPAPKADPPAAVPGPPAVPAAAPPPRGSGRPSGLLVVGGVLVLLLLASAAGIVFWPAFGPRVLQLVVPSKSAANAERAPGVPPPAAEAVVPPAPPRAEAPPVTESPASAPLEQPPHLAEPAQGVPTTVPSATAPATAPRAGIEVETRESARGTSAAGHLAPKSTGRVHEVPKAATEPKAGEARADQLPHDPPIAESPRTESRPAVPSPPVREKLTKETVDAFSGQRSSGSFDLGGAGATVAAVNRINWVLEQYATALARKDAAALQRYRRAPGPFEAQLLRARTVSVKIENVDVQVNGTSATATARRSIDATLASGEPLREQSPVTFVLVREQAGWVITDVR